MTAMLEYKGYFGSVDYSDEDQVLHGRLQFIRDLVTYEGTDAKTLKQAFQEAVDDYLSEEVPGAYFDPALHCCPVKKRTIPIGWLFAK